MDQLRTADDIVADDAALRARFAEDGYLFFRGLLDVDHVREVRRSFLEVLQQDGWLEAGTPLDDAVASAEAEPEKAPPSDHYLTTYEHIQRLQRFHELSLDPGLVGALERLFGDPVVAHPMKIARLGVPTAERWTTPAHQDFPILRGTPDFVTTWIPLGDCPTAMGGLKVLRGSSRGGSRPPVPARGVGGTGVEHDPDDPAWQTADFSPGDVLIFHCMTIHAAIPNTTERIRLSVDFRYQSVRAPMRRILTGPHYGNALPGYDELTSGWTSRRSVDLPPEVEVVADEELGGTEPELVSVDR